MTLKPKPSKLLYLIAFMALLFASFYLCNIGYAMADDNNIIPKGTSRSKLLFSQQHTVDLKPVPTNTPAPASKNKVASKVKYYKVVRVTHYCPCRTCNGNTLRRGAWGAYLREGMVASKDFPRGTRLGIEGKIYTVQDKCAKSGVVDIFVDGSHSEARRRGARYVKIAVY